MKYKDNLYKAEEGKLIVRISDDFVMGPEIDLGSADSIENYEERDFSKEEIEQLYKEWGIEYLLKRKRERRDNK